MPKTEATGARPATRSPRNSTPSTSAPNNVTNSSTTTSKKSRRASSGKKNSETAFNRVPSSNAAEKPNFLTALVQQATKKVTDAVSERDSGRQRSTNGRSEEKKGEAQPESGSKPASDSGNVSDDAKARRGTRTSNNGRADGGTQAGGHQGNRDVKIQKLKDRQERVAARRDDVKEKIEDLTRDIDNKRSESGAVGAVVDIATAPVTAIAGVFGRSNPIGDAAERAHDQIRGLEDRVKDLSREEEKLKQTEEQIAADIKALEDERALNFLADVAQVTNMPASVANALDGAGSVRIDVENETSLGSDAVYSRDTKSIIVDQEVIDRASDAVADLRRDGIVDSDGNIIDHEAFDSHSSGDAGISAAALLGVHEVTHESQDVEGLMRVADETRQRIISDAQKVAASAPASERGSIMQEANDQVELARINLLEYDAYVNQETLELQAGKTKQGFVTVNSDGSLLPRNEAVKNIFQFQLGLPLLYGESAGMTFTSAAASGDDTPGRRPPGDTAPGRRPPGDTAPGRRPPGSET